MSEFSTEIAKPFEFNNPGPLDKNRGPYATLADACKAIPNVTKLIDGVQRNLREGKIVDIGIEPNTVSHHWIGGFEDKHLVRENVEVGVNSDNIFNKGAEYIVSGKGIGTDAVIYNTNAGTISVIGMPVEDVSIPLVFSGINFFRGLRFEKQDGTLISPTSFIGSPVNGTAYSIPTETKRISFQLTVTGASLDAVQVEYGTVATPFKPYSQFVKNIDEKPLRASSLVAGAKMNGAEVATKNDIYTEVNPLYNDYQAFKNKTTYAPQIRPNASYGYSAFTASLYGTQVSRYFFKTQKQVGAIGVFIWKKPSAGAITNTRIQVLIKRVADGSSSILLDRTVPASKLTKFNTETVVGGYANYEQIELLSQQITGFPGDQLFVSVQSEGGLYPIFGTTDPLSSTGEWNDGTSCYRVWYPYATTTHTTVSPLSGAEGNYTALHFYSTSLTPYSLPEFDSRLKQLESGAGTGSEDFDFIAPKQVYFTNNEVITGRKEPLLMWAQRFIKEKFEAFINLKQDVIIASKEGLNSANVDQDTISFTLGGYGKVLKTISIIRISVKRSLLSNRSIGLLWNGDSITIPQTRNGIAVGAGALWAMAKEIAIKNKADNGGVGYELTCIGTTNGTGSAPFIYKGATYNMKGSAEGFGGWSTATWLRHPFRLSATNVGGSWDLLGLSTTQGRAYSGSNSDNILINSTCYGVNQPVISNASYTLLRAEGQFSRLSWPDLGAWTGAANQMSQMQNWIDGIANDSLPVQNRFFDYTKTGTNRFNFSKYLSRYKTLADDGVTRLVVGSTAGTRVTNVMDSDVYKPSHVVICLGENDRLFHTNNILICNDVLELANEYKSQIPTAHIGVCLTPIPGPMFPDRNPNFKGFFSQSYHNSKYDLYKELQSRFGTLAQQTANRVYLVPTWYCMTPYSNIITSEQVDESMPNNIIQVGIDDPNHPGYYANRSGGSQIYAWIAYTQSV